MEQDFLYNTSEGSQHKTSSKMRAAYSVEQQQEKEAFSLVNFVSTDI